MITGGWEIGDRGVIAPADHKYAGKTATVIGSDACAVCSTLGHESCGYDDLLLRLDDGTETRIYEPEFMPIGYLDDEYDDH
jgi:hypothetical protein